jgi:hypothetical protein
VACHFAEVMKPLDLAGADALAAVPTSTVV